MADSSSLIPVEERTVDFSSDPITAVLVPGDSQPDIYVPIRPLCAYLGLAWSGQYERLKRDPVRDESLRFVRVTRTHSSGGDPNVLCLPREYLPGWRCGINVSRVRPELQEKSTRYRRAWFRVLWRAFQADALNALGQRDERMGTTTDLVSVRDMGLAIVQMAEQQRALEQRVTEHDGRLDRAATVIKEVQRRLTSVDDPLVPSAAISDGQAAGIAARVKAITKALSERDQSKNHAQGVFGELYRRFRVTTYQHMRQEQHAAVLTL
ncbi:MAG TPA: phage antirepressor N-terminal domain-containing protein [Herpetosiphonaceae bacterium]